MKSAIVFMILCAAVFVRYEQHSSQLSLLFPLEKNPCSEIRKERIERLLPAAMKPGVSGWSVDKAQHDWIAETGSLPFTWGTGHPGA